MAQEPDVCGKFQHNSFCSGVPCLWDAIHIGHELVLKFFIFCHPHLLPVDKLCLLILEHRQNAWVSSLFLAFLIQSFCQELMNTSHIDFFVDAFSLVSPSLLTAWYDFVGYLASSIWSAFCKVPCHWFFVCLWFCVLYPCTCICTLFWFKPTYIKSSMSITHYTFCLLYVSCLFLLPKISNKHVLFCFVMSTIYAKEIFLAFVAPVTVWYVQSFILLHV